ncbi:hypothetical protein H2201_000775 [Coniosporium apollinis]|uniref:Heterokaryon incompatibility domain-containing protein n=1 Tax=Coniosporium apollinis TaxID=61459 RepID=A0ABQ9P2W4_9PEZI|nr:hypothetical protein H2201_000775 [Coniosporium apollinis]
MPPTCTQDIYGFYEPDRTDEVMSVDKDPVRLPHILSDDELEPFTLPRINADCQLRLIELLPPHKAAAVGSSDEPLQCTIHVYSLDEAPEYEALSYMWGSMHRHLPISVMETDELGHETEKALYATPQLMMALRRLRQSSNTRRLWIDQLCINQDNNDERGKQVQLMGSIYKKAQRVVVWLGEDYDHWVFEPTFRKRADTELLAETLSLFTIDQDTSLDDVGRAARLADPTFKYHVETVEHHRAVIIYVVLKRPWFRRAWVFQEASLAKELVVQYGGLEVRFEDLKRFCDAVFQLEVAQGIHKDRSLAMSTGGFEMMQFIQQTRRDVLQSSSTSQPSTLENSGLLCKLFQVLRRVQCQDPRDLIFAFLAFQGTENIVATAGSYNQPPEEVWTDATERIIRSSRSLDVFAALSGDKERELKLPSWVPYWADCFPYSRPIATPVSRFRASRGMPHVWAQHEDPSKLQVRGKIIDQVQAFIHPPFQNFMSAKHATHLFLTWDVLLGSTRGHLYHYDQKTKALGDYLPVKQKNIEGDLMRTVLADGALGSEQPLRRIHEMIGANATGYMARGLRQSRSTIALTEEQTQMLHDYERLENLALVAEYKQVFFTEHVQLGMAPQGAKIGDNVAILHGSKVPCLLRKLDHKENEYRVISQCHLQGWMYGNSPKDLPHPHGKWWDEAQDEFVLV